MTRVVVETRRTQPMTLEMLEEETERGLPCLEARDARWLYSLLSSDRLRMICLFDAPDVEAVRDAYRRAGLESRPIWPAETLHPEGVSPAWNEPMLNVVEKIYPRELTDADWHQTQALMLAFYEQQGIEWVRSHISFDRTRVICELNAPNAEVIRESHHKFGIPVDSVWSAELLKP